MNHLLVLDSSQPILRMGLWQDNCHPSEGWDQAPAGHASVKIGKGDPRLRGDDNYCEIQGATAYDASAYFFDYIDQLNPSHLSAVVGLTGPGSFTSLRTGLAALQGVAFARNIPAIGISCFEAYALSFPTNEPTLFLIESQRADHYAQIFQGGLPQGEPFLCTLEEARQKGLPIIGSAIDPTHLPDLQKVAAFVAGLNDPSNRPLLPLYGVGAHTS